MPETYPVTQIPEPDTAPRGTRIRETSGPTTLRVMAVADGEYLKRDGDSIIGAAGTAGGEGSGDVVGPASATANNLVAFNGTTGKLVKDAGGALPVKATGAEIDTGTDDAKFATPKAIADSGLASESFVTSAISGKADDSAVVHDTSDETIAGVKTFSSDPIIPDEAYGVGWNGSLEPPTKNAVYDKIETIGGGGITNSAGNNIVPKSDGTNLVASRFSDDGTNMLLNIGNAAAGTIQFGGTDGTRPGLRTNGVNLEVVTANQAAFTGLKAVSFGVNSTPPSTAVVGFATNHFGEISTELSILNVAELAYLPLRASGVRLMGTANLTVDTGLDRAGAGKVKPTNGAAGYGEFEMAASVRWLSGAGTPEGSITANVGSLYTRTDGGANTTLYVKESGTGNTGWVAK